MWYHQYTVPQWKHVYFHRNSELHRRPLISDQTNGYQAQGDHNLLVTQKFESNRNLVLKYLLLTHYSDEGWHHYNWLADWFFDKRTRDS